MKSKLTTYVLFAALIIIWGIIIIKIFFNEDSSTTESSEHVRPSSKKEDSTQIRLLLNYQDPFLNGVAKDTENKNNLSEHKPVTSDNPIIENLNAKYVGKIRSGKNEYHIIEQTGIQYSVAKGETIDGFYLKKIFFDSIHLEKNGHIYCLKLQN